MCVSLSKHLVRAYTDDRVGLPLFRWQGHVSYLRLHLHLRGGAGAAAGGGDGLGPSAPEDVALGQVAGLAIDHR